MTVNYDAFKCVHSFVLLEEHPRRRFATLACAASSALASKCPVEDEQTGLVYSGRQLAEAAEGRNPGLVMP